MGSRHYLGIDAGASKTGVTVINHSGELLATTRGGGSAIVGAPHPQARDVLRSLTTAVLTETGLSAEDITACGLGINGVDFADEMPVQLAGLAEAISIPAERITLVNDAIVALWGATPSPAAAILQIGTAFTSAFRPNVGHETLFDHLDSGKTVDIRNELLINLSRMIDGRVERTPLLERGLTYFEIDDESQFRDMLYRRRIATEKIRNSPPLLYTAWTENDPAAVAIVDKALDDYILTGRAMIRRTGSAKTSMVFGGGVILQAPEGIWERMEAGIKQEFAESTVHRPILPPECGAALLGAYAGGEAYHALFAKLREHYEN